MCVINKKIKNTFFDYLFVYSFQICELNQVHTSLYNMYALLFI